MPDALQLLKTRRSVKPMELTGPAPSEAEIASLLTIASRVPDHGKLKPWRFIVFAGDARIAAGETIAAAFRANRPDATPEQIEFERNRLARAPLVIAVVSRAGPHVKIPEWEQQAVGRRFRHEPGVCRPRHGLRGELDHRVVCLRSVPFFLPREGFFFFPGGGPGREGPGKHKILGQILRIIAPAPDRLDRFYQPER